MIKAMYLLKVIVILSVLFTPYTLMYVNAQEEVQVEIAEGSKNSENGKFYVPSRITIPVGTTVIWKNFDDAAHTVTDGTPESSWGTIFDSEIMRLDDVYEFTFNETGTYPYLCALHPWMIGTVTVLGERGEGPVELSVKPDKATYKVGDDVIIEGRVSMFVESMPLMIEVLDPNNKNLLSDSLSVDNDGNFIFNFKLAGKQIIPGPYTVKVSYSDAHAEGVFVVESGIVDGNQGNTDVRVAAKQIRDLLLVRVRNADSSMTSIYSVTIETSDSVIEAFRGPRSWNDIDVTSKEATSSVGDEPLNPGEKTYFKLKVANDNFVINWFAYDSSNNVVDQGEVKPIRR